MSNRIGSSDHGEPELHYADDKWPALVEEGVLEGTHSEAPTMVVIKGYEIVKNETPVKFPVPHQEAAKPPKIDSKRTKDTTDQESLQPVPVEASDVTRDFGEFPALTEEVAKQALVDYVSKKSCWGKGTAQNINYERTTSSSYYQYILETFAESRAYQWTNEPFYGQTIDNHTKGSPPLPEKIDTKMGEHFQDATLTIEIPKTANVLPCHVCDARGYLICGRCEGRVKLSCGPCHGKGFKDNIVTSKCDLCFGSGHHECKKCHHDGKKTCPSCKGHSNLKWFIELTIAWINKMDNHTVAKTDLPSELIEDARGIASKETQVRIWPVSNFTDDEINNTSKQLVEKHVNSFTEDVILLQRQTIRAVQVTECVYKHNDSSLKYYVYGVDNTVYAPDYPEQSCCAIV